MVGCGSRPDPDHLRIMFSNIRGHKLSLVRRFEACLVPKIMGEAQGRGWKGFWGLEPVKKIQKSKFSPENPKIPEIPLHCYK